MGENYCLHLNIAGLEVRSSAVVLGDAEAAQGSEPPWPGLSLQVGEKRPGPSQGRDWFRARFLSRGGCFWRCLPLNSITPHPLYFSGSLFLSF